VDHTEHALAAKLKRIGRGIAGILRPFRHRQRLPLPKPQDAGRQDRCRVGESLLAGRARTVSAVGHVVSPHENGHRSRRWLGQVRGRARPLLFTYRAKERAGGEIESGRLDVKIITTSSQTFFRNELQRWRVSSSPPNGKGQLYYWSRG
jgi:hypothetical protein